MSKMDFTPAETKPTGQRVSSCRSAETSIATTRSELNIISVNSEMERTVLAAAMYSTETINPALAYKSSILRFYDFAYPPVAKT